MTSISEDLEADADEAGAHDAADQDSVSSDIVDAADVSGALSDGATDADAKAKKSIATAPADFGDSGKLRSRSGTTTRCGLSDLTVNAFGWSFRFPLPGDETSEYEEEDDADEGDGGSDGFPETGAVNILARAGMETQGSSSNAPPPNLLTSRPFYSRRAEKAPRTPASTCRRRDGCRGGRQPLLVQGAGAASGTG